MDILGRENVYEGFGTDIVEVDLAVGRKTGTRIECRQVLLDWGGHTWRKNLNPRRRVKWGVIAEGISGRKSRSSGLLSRPGGTKLVEISPEVVVVKVVKLMLLL